MTNNEAISKIKFLLDVGGSDGFTSSDEEALNMAINALSAEITAPPKTNGDRIRQMTDKELAEVYTGLIINALYSPTFFYSMLKEEQIMSANLEWMRKEVDEDA